jgi:3-hydroxyacyl-CoA dehydrogenase
MESQDVIIVGAGVIGLNTAYELAKNNIKVLLGDRVELEFCISLVILIRLLFILAKLVFTVRNSEDSVVDIVNTHPNSNGRAFRL